ncbi:MAG: hypothetical protein RIT45_2239, partial [Pseudomonadota bacterium]
MRANLTFRSPLMWAVALLLTASCGEDTIVKGNETGDVTVGTDGQLDVGGVEDGSGLADGAGGEDSAVGDGSGGVDGVVSADADSGGGGEDSDATGTDDADATGTDDADAATDPDGAETGDDADASTAPDGSETSDDADGSTIGDTDTNANCPFGVDCACNTDADCDPIFVCVEKDGAKTCQSPCKPTDPADEVCDGLDNDCDGETDEGTCTDTACATSVCTQAEDKTWSCATTPTGAGPCDDGNACTEGDSCINGVCTGTSKNCDDGNPCTADSCDKNNGCDTKAVDGPCDDGNACTEGDACKDGGCVGAAKNCDDNNPCTTDSCDLAGACTVAMNDGAACDDGDACTGKDTCASGTCKGTTSCDDGDACTTDACESGKCTHTKSDCDDGNACTKDACDLAVGCTSVAVEGVIACDDNNPCTVNDACFGGGCTGSAKDCDDNDPCTADACDAGTGCTHAAADGACDDGDACTDNDACKDGKCAGGGAKDCDDGNPCTVDACSAGTCSHETGNDFAACDDGDACTGKDACAGGVCKGSETKACDDGNACTDDACDPKSGCVNTPNAGSCDDGNACTDKDACDGGTCKGSAKDAAACDDGNACTKDSCDPKLGCSSDITAGASCDDGEACTAGDTCDASGKCQPGANNCECKTDADCKDDGNLCNGTLVCQSNKCVTDPATVVVCDPGADTGCLVATCDPKTGDCSPTAVNEGKPCGDGNACTLGNTCAKGVCADGSTAKCDDGDACTTDACDAKTGACSTTPIEGCVTCVDVSACDDKDPCTADACKGGLCTHDAIAGCSKGPQLVTGKVTVGIPQANAGSAVTVSFEVTNSGLSAAGPFKIAVMLSKDVTPDKDDAIVQVIDVPGLSSKQSTSQKLSIVLPSTLASGTWQIVVLADSAAAIAEDDEADNSAAVAISINALPDLTIASWSTDKDFYGPGTYIQFAAVTKNIGGGKAPSNSVTRVYISADGNLAGATYMAQFGVGGLAAGGTQNHSGWVKLPTLKQGTYTLLVVADFTKTVAEGNEDNNVVSKKIQIGPVSNLRPTALNATGSYAGNVISASYAVINDSNQGATAGARKDRLVLSKNATYSSDDIELGVY